VDRLRKSAARLVVLVGDAQGNAPHLGQESDAWEVLSISLGSGAHHLDAFKVRYRLDRTGRRLQDSGPPRSERRQLEVRRLDDDGEPTLVVAWGFLTGVEQRIDAGDESLVCDVRIERYAFGEPFRALPVHDPLHGPLDLHLPCVFNPEVDGRIEGNRSRQADDRHGPDVDGFHPWYFLFPESTTTEASRAFQVHDRTKWTLAEAVHRLCWTCNPQQKWIKNPGILELQDVFGFSDDDVKNVRVDYGQYLPDCLDQLLYPLGYSWRLRSALDDAGERVTTLHFFRRGQGPPVELRLQRIGEQFDFRRTDVDRFSLSTQLAALANKVTVRGGFPRIEATFSLSPAWPGAEDDHDLADLEPGQPGAQQHPDVFRKWVLNEAVDYENDREPPSDNPPIDFGYVDLMDKFSRDDFRDELVFCRRRRRLYPCLSLVENEDGVLHSREYVVEWWDRDQPQADSPHDHVDPGWRPVAEPFSVLEQEAGILFHRVPQDLIYVFRELTSGPAPDGVEHPGLFLRITACVDADARLERSRTSAHSPQGETIELVLDLPDKFQLHRRSSYSAFHGRTPAAEVDDRTALEEYAARVVQVEDAAHITCTIGLPGVDHADLEISQVVHKLSGREIALRAAPPGGAERPLQIVGLRLSLEGEQRTELVLEQDRRSGEGRA
jgi:hypothetical protein